MPAHWASAALCPLGSHPDPSQRQRSGQEHNTGPIQIRGTRIGKGGWQRRRLGSGGWRSRAGTGSHRGRCGRSPGGSGGTRGSRPDGGGRSWSGCGYTWGRKGRRGTGGRGQGRQCGGGRGLGGGGSGGGSRMNYCPGDGHAQQGHAGNPEQDRDHASRGAQLGIGGVEACGAFGAFGAW